MGYTAEKLIFIFFPQNFQLFLNTQVNAIRIYEPKVTRFDLAIFLSSLFIITPSQCVKGCSNPSMVALIVISILNLFNFHFVLIWLRGKESCPF